MKEFKTLTIRNLDKPDSSDLVEIVNHVIDSSDYWNNVGTAQKAIEYIIREYNRQKARIEEKDNEIAELKQSIRDRERRESDVKQFFKLLDQIPKDFN